MTYGVDVLPETLPEPINAQLTNVWRTTTVHVLGFGRFPNGCVAVRYAYPDQFLARLTYYTAPIRVFDF